MLITQEDLPMVVMPSMNDTHLEEIILINRLDKAAREDNINEVSALLEELLEHTIMHFGAEEEMMKEAGFPAYEMHKSEHERHLQEFQSLMQHFEQNRDTRAICVYIEGALIPWLIQHIKTMDTMTALFLKEGLSSGCSAT